MTWAKRVLSITAGTTGGKPLQKKMRLTTKSIPWSAIRTDFLRANLDPTGRGPVTLKAIAEKWGIKYATLAARASSERWTEELKDRADMLAKEIEAGTKKFLYDEIEVRGRQAKHARMMSDLGSRRLRFLLPQHLSAREAAALVKIGLEEERKAIGMPDLYTYVPPSGSQPSDDEAAPEARIHKARVMRSLGEELLRFLAAKDVTPGGRLH